MPVRSSVMYVGCAVSLSSRTLEPALVVVAAESNTSWFMQARKFANSGGKVGLSMTEFGTATAGPGYEHRSFPSAAMTLDAGGDTSKDAMTVSASSLRSTTAAFCALIKYARISIGKL
jgi:hypothetical protein